MNSDPTVFCIVLIRHALILKMEIPETLSSFLISLESYFIVIPNIIVV